MVLYWENTCQMRNFTTEINNAQIYAQMRAYPIFLVANLANSTYYEQPLNISCKTDEKLQNIKQGLNSFDDFTVLTGLFLHGGEKSLRTDNRSVSSLLSNPAKGESDLSSLPVFLVPTVDNDGDGIWDFNALMVIMMRILNGTFSYNLEKMSTSPNSYNQSVDRVFNITMLQTFVEESGTVSTSSSVSTFDSGNLIIVCIFIFVLGMIALLYQYRKSVLQDAARLRNAAGQNLELAPKAVLSPADLNRIPLETYSTIKSQKEFNSTNSDTETVGCSICIEQFDLNDQVRILPGCKHMFHMNCVDNWLLKTNTNCPNCRLDCRVALGLVDDIDEDDNHGPVQEQEPEIEDNEDVESSEPLTNAMDSTSSEHETK
ncbi:hypothetical protein HK098_000512 [Nowakowskiella sp. JEL0407]|nr:hypothetical protein HK098_000512 [Nowakowskiella sp. JEL0407]